MEEKTDNIDNAKRTTGFSPKVVEDLKKLNKALLERKRSMKLTQTDRDREFCFQIGPMKRS